MKSLWEKTFKAGWRFIRSDLRTSSVVTLFLWRDNMISKKAFSAFLYIQPWALQPKSDMLLLYKEGTL